jgi:hypothetical protein
LRRYEVAAAGDQGEAQRAEDLADAVLRLPETGGARHTLDRVRGIRPLDRLLPLDLCPEFGQADRGGDAGGAGLVFNRLIPCFWG